MMKRSLLLMAMMLCAASANAEKLNTPSFTIAITRHCTEGNVSCDNVSYIGTSKKTGKAIRLRGKTLHSLCADGVTPCRFQGYEFRSGNTYYLVTESGRLEVTLNHKTLVSEQGQWQ
jgi:hypothetical protein